MDNKDTPERRRSLPIPNAVLQTPARPNTPVVGAPVPPSSFYSTPQNPPPLPTRRNAGSSYTTYLPPLTPPTSMDTPFREPELVQDNQPVDNDSIPGLVPEEVSTEQGWSNTNLDWEAEDWINGWKKPAEYDSLNLLAPNSAAVRINIDGRDTEEELHWWDPVKRARSGRPGPGMLPPVLADALHNPDHSLFTVIVTPPDLSAATAGTSNTPKDSPQPAASVSPEPGAATTSQPPKPPPPPPPRPDEFRTAVPHPNAYYCTKDNGWVILSWKSSTVLPPLARSFLETPHSPLPSQRLRLRNASCIVNEEHPFGQTNMTHHFHRYPSAVDALKLTPPFRRTEWESLEKVKQKRRAVNIMDIDVGKIEEDNIMEEDIPEEEASPVIPGVIPRKYFMEYVKERQENPPVGKTGEQSVVGAWETILLLIENKLFKGENRNVRVTRPTFQHKMGWTSTVRRIVDALGFTKDNVDGTEDTLRPPLTDITTPEGKKSRAKLLRAWVEISVWLTDFRRIYASQFRDHKHQLHVQIDSAREYYQNAIGAHPEQIPRGMLPGTILVQPLHKSWEALGLTPTSYSFELLAFAYYAQCRCDPGHTTLYFTHFYKIVKSMLDLGICPPDLQTIVAEERSRDRFTEEDVEAASKTLGFGLEEPLKVEFDSDVPEQFIADAWRDCVKRAWRDHEHGGELQRAANEAFRILTEARESPSLRKLWEDVKDKMNPDRAYDILEVPKDVEDESMLILVFSMRLQEQPTQEKKWKEALSVIADIKDSERLRQYLSTGTDPGEIIAPTRPDLPRGLNQLGNTCYLNSLLQYFYTIKELRDAVAPMASLDLKSLEDDKLSDDDLKRHRVGGRLVTRREIARSRKFISQLADLFWNLEYCESAAVTPSIELAKLALVTSRDEEEDEADRGGTDSSNDTDATLVEDGPSRLSVSGVPPQSPAQSPGSILGKRPRDFDRQPSAMDVDIPALESPKGADGAIASTPRQSQSPQPTSGEGSLSSKFAASGPLSEDKDDDIEMHGDVDAPSKPPPLPPRKAAPISDSVMMFGKQHDVAECMDNCMFQIEAALLKFEAMSGSQDAEKTSVVKKLFYGKIRQRLAIPSDERKSRSSVHEKEDLFSHLPVNVTDDGVDIYDGLSGYFDDVVEFKGQKARMEVTLVDLPPLLQIQLQRVQFNRETLQPYKSQAYVKFGETIFMDRFLDSADPEKKSHSKAIQAELNSCRDRMRLLTQGKDGQYITALSNVHEFLSKQDGLPFSDGDEDVMFCLKEDQDLIKQEVDELRARVDSLKIKLEDIWRDHNEVAYELTSVFIHRGSSPSWGHYFFYSRHLPDNPDSWFKYNDSDVSVVSKDEVLADTTGSTANPYLLVFARKGVEVVETVKRFDPTSLEE